MFVADHLQYYFICFWSYHNSFAAFRSNLHNVTSFKCVSAGFSKKCSLIFWIEQKFLNELGLLETNERNNLKDSKYTFPEMKFVAKMIKSTYSMSWPTSANKLFFLYRKGLKILLLVAYFQLISLKTHKYSMRILVKSFIVTDYLLTKDAPKTPLTN